MHNPPPVCHAPVPRPPHPHPPLDPKWLCLLPRGVRSGGKSGGKSGVGHGVLLDPKEGDFWQADHEVVASCGMATVGGGL